MLETMNITSLKKCVHHTFSSKVLEVFLYQLKVVFPVKDKAYGAPCLFVCFLKTLSLQVGRLGRMYTFI